MVSSPLSELGRNCLLYQKSIITVSIATIGSLSSKCDPCTLMLTVTTITGNFSRCGKNKSGRFENTEARGVGLLSQA